MRTTGAWAFWRRMQYISGFTVFFLLIGAWVYFANFYQEPTCFDGRQNGDEAGIDCGGSCVRICAFSVLEPSVKWSRSFKVTNGIYNAVAYIENQNREAGSPEVRYTFTLYDESGVITTRSGTTILPPDGLYPIFEGRIETGYRVPSRTFIEIEPITLWQPATIGREQFTVVSRELVGADARPRLDSVLRNNELEEVREVEVVATIFDSAGTALATSRTFVDNFRARTDSNIVFTWPEPIAKTVRSCELPSDVILMLDRSGSMAADGGEPSEPLESAKRASIDFVNQLRANDQIAILSYATSPSSPIEQTLTNSKNSAILSIEGISMGTDGVQYTNMGEAFRAAASELQSVRHRENARKVAILMTDGDVTRPLNPQGQRDIEYAANYARLAADNAKENDILVYTIGFGNFFVSNGDVINRDVDLIKDLATDRSMYYEAPTLEDLKQVYRQIADAICEDGPAVIDIVPKSTSGFVPLR